MKKGIIHFLVLIFTCSIIFVGCSNSSETLNESKDVKYKKVKAKLENATDGYSKYNKYSGQILAAKDGVILINRAYGMADYGQNTKNTSETVFEIGQVTEQFTIAATLMLEEKKLLNGQDTINKYIPDFPNGDKIKISNLLTNTSGIPEYMENGIPQSGSQTYTKQQLMELFKNKPLNFEPGSKFRISNSNFIVLGYIIEKVTGMKYEEYINDKIIRPLKMRNTGFLRETVNLKNKAVGYSTLGTGTKPTAVKAQESEPSFLYSAGEMYSTAEDLYLFESALFGGKLIKKETLKEVTTVTVKPEIGVSLGKCGCGWTNLGNDSGNKLVTSKVIIPGYSITTCFNISKNYVYIMLSNRENDDGTATYIEQNLETELSKKN